ncbi:Late competence protein ComGC [Alkalibacterium sp. AK22]|uniref:competence type IV pilus major pilin ComGC n=1 Tax=Alkalibacterium sp. AK22 TaxID=1229520 RepID=UPI000449B764|nr:competence type IV pilus major pilin ComGC [Alkalibacterium sp. AK22]EXJ22777.1 Late competence protein ComGC [Alkalibacterium sp. AK22]
MCKVLKKRLRQDKGFTLIEMTLVLFIISALLLLFIPNLTGRQDKADNTSTQAMETVLQSQVELYRMDVGSHPESFESMKQGNYLTSSQVERAKKDFNLSGGQVIRK